GAARVRGGPRGFWHGGGGARWGGAPRRPPLPSALAGPRRIVDAGAGGRHRAHGRAAAPLPPPSAGLQLVPRQLRDPSRGRGRQATLVAERLVRGRSRDHAGGRAVGDHARDPRVRGHAYRARSLAQGADGRGAHPGVEELLGAPRSLAGYRAQREPDRVHAPHPLRQRELPGARTWLAHGPGAHLYPVRSAGSGRGHSRLPDQLSHPDLALRSAEPQVHVHRPGRLRALRSDLRDRTLSEEALLPSIGSAVAPLRREPAHESECVTQGLYGERFEILESTPDGAWLRGRLLADGYAGWI